MTTSRMVRPRLQPVMCLLALSFASGCWAGALDVTVVDAHGAPVGLVAVYAVPDKPAAATPAKPTAVMDQKRKEFVPHVLVVQTGTSVDFPNNDTVSHHVYSFSEPKSFELPLYKGDAHPPLVFDKPGIVVLGCNIHDEMLGYIYVVDTPYFATTDEAGKARIALPAGGYSVRVWTPRAGAADLPMEVAVTLDGANRSLAFQIKGRLQPEHDHGGAGLSWQRY
ncbi:MAG TPA: methylamine utilization protein [Gammaproteobacteria bacterium]|nr:methylamine utilization protein [Gammaproteobacteria bacterium]